MKIPFLPGTLLTVAVLFFVVSCNHDDDTPVDPESTSVHTIIVDANMAQKLQSIDSDGTLTFNGLTAEEMPQIGGIICSAPINKAPRGFFYGVKFVTKNGSTTVVKTKFASIADAVGKDSISVTSAVGSISDIMIEETPLDNLSLSGSFKEGEYSIHLEAVVKGRETTSLTLFCTISGKLNLAVSGSFNRSLATQYDQILATVEAAPITFMIGKIPVVITPTIPVTLQLHYDGVYDGTLITTNHTCSVEAGIQYKDKKMEFYSKDTSPAVRPILTGLDAIIDGSLSTSINADVQFQLYNHTPAVMNTVVEFYGRAEVSPRILNSERIGLAPVLNTYIGKTGKINADMTDFGVKTNISYADTINEDITLRQNVFPEFSPVTFDNITATSLTAQTSVASATLNYLFPVTEYGFCWSSSTQPDIHNDAHTSLGALNTAGAAFNANITMNNNAHFYVYPYFTNALGTFYGKGRYRGETISPCSDTLTITVKKMGFTASVTWACANCGEPGEFVSPLSPGTYYRWNRLGWNDVLDAIPAIGNLWTVNPCPKGYTMLTDYNKIIFTLGEGMLSECVAEVDGYLAEGYCYQSPDGRYLFFPRTGYMDENGNIIDGNSAYTVVNNWLHTHTPNSYDFLATYYGQINKNSTYLHAIVPITTNPAGPGYPVRCIYCGD